LAHAPAVSSHTRGSPHRQRGFTGMSLTKPPATRVEANAAATRLSLDRSFIVQVWDRERMIAWYENGVTRQRESDLSEFF